MIDLPRCGAKVPPTPYDLESFFQDNPTRLAHMRDAAEFAVDMSRGLALPDDHAALLARAALLHDIGYASVARRTGYHPLDGGLFLEGRHEHAWVVDGVLRHSGADRKGATMPGIGEYYHVRPAVSDAAWLVRAVTVADWRSAGIGGRVSFGQRVTDIIDRHPGDALKAERTRTMLGVVRGWFVEWARGFAGLPWVFCDIDQTLIVPGAALDAENRRAVRAYAAAGGRFSLATGKHPASIAPLVAELGLDTPQLTVNGTCVLQHGATRVLSHLGHSARALISALVGMGLPVAVYREQSIEARGPWLDLYDTLYDRYGEIRPLRTPQDGVVLKVLCIADQADVECEAALRALAERLGVLCCRSDRHFIEFLPRGGTKGDGVRSITQHAGWPPLHTLAMGDNENDATMFAQCGACAAVGNAQENALRGADWILPACAAQGVASLLDKVRNGAGWRAFG